jgi:SAM-dependent methyltransferase
VSFVVKQEEYGRMYALEGTHWWYAGMRAISAAVMMPAVSELPASRRILDAGCGTGQNVDHLSPLGRCLGVDLSEEALQFCTRRGVTVVRGNLLKLPIAPATFDLVTSFDVLYHRWITDDRAALRELVRVTKPGGLVFVRVPALKMLWGAHDEAVFSRHRYTRGELRQLFADCGLDVLRATYCNSLLFPVLALRRALDRLSGREGSDVESLAPPIEHSFRTLLALEAFFLRTVRFLSFPVGGSVVALGRRRPE